MKPEDADIGDTTKDAMIDKADRRRRLRAPRGRRQRRADDTIRPGRSFA